MRNRSWVAVAGAGVVLLVGCSSQTAGVPTTGPSVVGTAISGATTARSATTGSSTASTTPLTLRVVTTDPLDATELSRAAAAADAVLAEQKIPATVISKLPGQLTVTSKVDPAVIEGILGGSRKLSWLPVSGSVPATPAQCRAAPTARSQCSIAGDNRYTLGPAAVALSGVTATSQVDPNQGGAPVVTLTYDSATAGAVGKYTAAHFGKTMALSDGRQVITAPLIQAVITTPSTQISGHWTKTEAAAIAGRITLAALQVEIRRG